MSQTQLADVIVPSEFTDYTVQNTMAKTAVVQAGMVARNPLIDSQLALGAPSFAIPFWNDLADVEADIASDNPAALATPSKLTASKQVVRKNFLHKSWSSMSLASELAGSNALQRIQERVVAYWQRQAQKRLVSTLQGILAANVASNAGDMVLDISTASGTAADFSADAFINAAATLGDNLTAVTGMAVHSATYAAMLRANEVDQLRLASDGSFITTYHGVALVVDDGMPVDTSGSDPVYTSCLFGSAAVGFGLAPPNFTPGTELWRVPDAGNGGGQDILHSRVHLALHPAGYKWTDASVAAESPTVAELALAANWSRVVERKAVPLAFLRHKVAA